MKAKRKLAAILSADVVGYSRLMADDEAATLRVLNEARALFGDRIQSRGWSRGARFEDSMKVGIQGRDGDVNGGSAP